jgi:hypothetical protein
MFSHEALFRKDIDDLRGFIANPTEARLLLEQRIEHANKNVRCKLHYRVEPPLPPPKNPVTGREMPRSDFEFNNPFPDQETRDVRVLKRDEFLAWTVLSTKHRDFSVYDIVHYVCNRAGGRHKIDPKNAEEKELEAIAIAIRLGGPPSALYAVLPISQVVEAACSELYAALATKGG